jgi:16S rRNA (guanine966-N2)-methyltransferase
VREALFSILGSALDLEGLRVLDLYAGSGALGLEALSRGAAAAVFVDSSRRCQQVILENARTLGFSQRCRLLPIRVSQGVEQLRLEGARFGLVLADPPYAEAPRPLLELVDRGDLVGDGGRLVVEHGPRNEPPRVEGGLCRVVHRRYGDSVLSIYRRKVELEGEGSSAYKHLEDNDSRG